MHHKVALLLTSWMQTVTVSVLAAMMASDKVGNISITHMLGM